MSIREESVESREAELGIRNTVCDESERRLGFSVKGVLTVWGLRSIVWGVRTHAPLLFHASSTKS